MSCLLILETNPFSVTSFTSIFSLSLCCLFILFIVSSTVQRFLSLSGSHLFIFCFYFHCSGRWIEEETATIYVRQCSAYIFHVCSDHMKLCISYLGTYFDNFQCQHMAGMNIIALYPRLPNRYFELLKSKMRRRNKEKGKDSRFAVHYP